MTEDRAHLLRTAVSMQQEFVVSSEAVETEARAHTMQELEVWRESAHACVCVCLRVCVCGWQVFSNW